MDNYLKLIEEISKYVINLFDRYDTNHLLYHNLEHTKTVVKRTYEIAVNYDLDDKELFILSAAAWFHDTGQLDGDTNLHEDRSVIIMKKFFETKGTGNEIIEKIESCICATKLPQQPKSISEEIICDADTYNLGTEDFCKTDKLLKKEFQLRKMSIDNWEEKTLELLLTHTYFTSYCQKRLAKGKKKNIDFVRHLLAKKSK